MKGFCKDGCVFIGIVLDCCYVFMFIDVFEKGIFIEFVKIRCEFFKFLVG